MHRKTEIKKILSTLSTHTPVDYENLLRTRFPYRIPQNYLQWDELSSYVAYSMAASATMLNSLDQVSNYVKHRTSLWALQEAPLFLLSEDLLQLFEETKIAEDNKFLAALLDQLKIIYPTLILLLPKSKPFRDGNGDIIDYVVIHCHRPDQPELSEANRWGINLIEPAKVNLGSNWMDYEGLNPGLTIMTKKYKLWINWCGISTGSQQFFSARGIPADGHHDPSSFAVEDEKTIDSTLKLREIVLQSLLLICSKPELVISSESLSTTQSQTKGFVNQKSKKEKVLYPRVLNLNYAEKAVKEGEQDPSIPRTGTPQRPHWRLGYKAKRRCGKVKGVPPEQWQYKEVEVLSYLVLGNRE